MDVFLFRLEYKMGNTKAGESLPHNELRTTSFPQSHPNTGVNVFTADSFSWVYPSNPNRTASSTTD